MMRKLRDLEGTKLETDKEKAGGLVRDLVGRNEETEVEGPLKSIEYGPDEF